MNAPLPAAITMVSSSNIVERHAACDQRNVRTREFSAHGNQISSFEAVRIVGWSFCLSFLPT